MPLKFFVDAEDIASQFGDFKLEVEQDIVKAVGGLAAMTHGLTIEKAQQELHSTRDRYVNALSFEEVAEGVWVVSLDEPALFIEEGLPANFDMKPGLLKDSKVSSKGVQYRVIPFDHSTPPSQNTIKKQTLVNQIKKGLKDKGVGFKSIEKDANGSPRVGRLHKDINLGGPVMGRGNTPVMNGINVYQTKTATGGIRRDVMTFRTVTSAQTDKWIHPGLDAKKFMDKALEEAMAIWENEILPQVLAKWK